MIALLLVLIAIGIFVEVISLKRDPDTIHVDFGLSASATEPDAPFEVHTVITNEGRLPVSYINLKEHYPLNAQIPEGVAYEERYDGRHVENICRVGGRRKKTRKLSISIEKRGVHLFRGGTLKFGDFLGLSEIEKTVGSVHEILVYPKRLDMPQLVDALGNFCGDISARQFLIRDPILTIGSREYTGREPMRDIHWLQSARKGGLMVREFDYTRQLSAVVILSTKGVAALEDDELDACCSLARTVCETLAGLNVHVNFFTNAGIFQKRATEVHQCTASAGKMGALLEMLSRVSNHTYLPTDALCRYAASCSDPDSAFVLILAQGDRSGGQAAEELRRSTGQEVMVLYGGSGKTNAEENSA